MTDPVGPRVYVEQNRTWFMSSTREKGLRWIVRCEGCAPEDPNPFLSLFARPGRVLGGTNDHTEAVTYADMHSRLHKRCECCGQITPVPGREAAT